MRAVGSAVIGSDDDVEPVIPVPPPRRREDYADLLVDLSDLGDLRGRAPADAMTDAVGIEK